MLRTCLHYMFRTLPGHREQQQKSNSLWILLWTSERARQRFCKILSCLNMFSLDLLSGLSSTEQNFDTNMPNWTEKSLWGLNTTQNYRQLREAGQGRHGPPLGQAHQLYSAQPSALKTCIQVTYVLNNNDEKHQFEGELGKGSIWESLEGWNAIIKIQSQNTAKHMLDRVANTCIPSYWEAETISPEPKNS